VLAHVGERDAELIEIDRALALCRRMEACGIETQAGAARREFVACDAAQVGGIDEEFVLGDADRQEVGDVVVGHSVVVAGPGHEAVDTADAVDDTRGIVRMPWQGDEVRALLGEALEGGALVQTPVVDDVVEPVRELGAHIVEVAKLAAVEERALDLPERALRARLVVGGGHGGPRAGGTRSDSRMRGSVDCK